MLLLLLVSPIRKNTGSCPLDRLSKSRKIVCLVHKMLFTTKIRLFVVTFAAFTLIVWNRLLRGPVSVLHKASASPQPRPSVVGAIPAKHLPRCYCFAVSVVTLGSVSMTWPLIHCRPLLVLEDALDANSMPDPLYSRLSSARQRRKVIIIIINDRIPINQRALLSAVAGCILYAWILDM